MHFEPPPTLGMVRGTTLQPEVVSEPIIFSVCYLIKQLASPENSQTSETTAKRNGNEGETLLVKLGHTSLLRAFMTTVHAASLS